MKSLISIFTIYQKIANAARKYIKSKRNFRNWAENQSNILENLRKWFRWRIIQRTENVIGCCYNLDKTKKHLRETLQIN